MLCILEEEHGVVCPFIIYFYFKLFHHIEPTCKPSLRICCIIRSVDAVSDRDFVLEFLSANAIAAIHLSRLGEEWVLWASEEFGFLIPSDSVSTGSSIMPQKKNPDPMELVRGKSARVVGSLTTLLVLCKGLPLAYNRDLQVVQHRVFVHNLLHLYFVEKKNGILSITVVSFYCL